MHETTAHMRTRVAIARTTAICIFVIATSLPAVGATIQLMVGGIEKQIYLPVALAERLGYFKEQGLDVHVLSDTSGVSAEDELLTGGVQGVVGFYDHTIDLQAKGKFVEAVVQFSRAPGEAVVVSARRAQMLRSPGDFGSHRIGVTGLGSSTYRLVRYLAAAAGVKSGDMALVAVGSGSDFSTALRDGRVDAGMTTEPTVSQLIRSGEARLLVDMRTPAEATASLGGIYPGACLYMSTPWIASHPDDVQRLVNAFVKALRFIDDHSAQEIASVVPAAYFAGNRALYVSTLQESKSMFIADGAMPEGGPANVLRTMRLADHDLVRQPIDLSQTTTARFTRRSH